MLSRAYILGFIFSLGLTITACDYDFTDSASGTKATTLTGQGDQQSQCADFSDKNKCEQVGCLWRNKNSDPNSFFCEGTVQPAQPQTCDNYQSQANCEQAGCLWRNKNSDPNVYFCE